MTITRLTSNGLVRIEYTGIRLTSGGLVKGDAGGVPPEPSDDLHFIGSTAVAKMMLGGTLMDKVMSGTTQVFPAVAL